MRVVGWMDHPLLDTHTTGPGHPESPARLRAIRDALHASDFIDLLVRAEPLPVARGLLTSVHSSHYVSEVEALAENGGGYLDEDTAVAPDSFHAALLAAGAVEQAVTRVLRGEWQRAFCSVRPPGHHARPAAGMGFCLFNNVAVGAAAALATGLVQRVAILDWDVHHGNGTEEIFQDRDDVFFASSHQHPLYPGTGNVSRGGTSINCPLAAGSGDAQVLDAWSKHVGPALETFAPELILISAGFDADLRDPLASLGVTPEGFAQLTALVSGWADRHASGRIVSVLEGGYDLAALAEDTVLHVRTLLEPG